MGSEFLAYLRLGFHHIADPRGIDHILFVAALAAPYPAAAWRRLLWLVTAFTIGHSITLVLATLDLVRVDAGVVEALIPVTILVMALVAIRAGRTAGMLEATPGGAARWRLGQYLLAAGFGLIHGLGFSSFLRAALGAEESIALPLFAFNVGLEAGQAAIVLAVLAAGAAAGRLLGLARREWVLVVSGAAAGIAATMLADRWPS